MALERLLCTCRLFSTWLGLGVRVRVGVGVGVRVRVRVRVGVRVRGSMLLSAGTLYGSVQKRARPSLKSSMRSGVAESTST